MVSALGHVPVARERTTEEHAIDILRVYHRSGYGPARTLRANGPTSDTRVLLMHAIVAAMRGQWSDAYRLQSLARI